MRALFFGTPEIALPTLDLVAAQTDLVCVVTPPDRPAGRRRRLRRPPVAERAAELGLPLRQPERASDPAFCEELAALRPDVAIVFAFGEIFRKRLLAVPRLGMFNVHTSLLPRHRGPSPIHAAIAAGDERTGVTLFRLVRRMDAGPMLVRRETPIGPRETAGELHDRLALLGAELTGEGLALLAERGADAPLEPQDEAAATYCSLLDKADGVVAWDAPADAVDRQVRAVTPWPGAQTGLGGRRLLIARAEPLPAGTAGCEGAPGTRVDGPDPREHPLVVACAAGALSIRRVKPAGRREMSAADFLRGTPVEPAARFEVPAA